MGTPKLTNKQKLSIVIEGVKGRLVSEICTSYGISQAQYYRIRDQFFSKAEEVFATQTPDRKRESNELFIIKTIGVKKEGKNSLTF